MEQPTPWDTVLSYSLFGEVGDLPDVVHCETIETRSKLHGWELAPHRHARLHQVLLVRRGGGEAVLDGNRHQLRHMTVLNVPEGHIHGFKFQPDTDGWVVTLASETSVECLRHAAELHPVLTRSGIFSADEEILDTVERIFAEHGSLRFGRSHFLRVLTGLLLGLVGRHLLADGFLAHRPIADERFKHFEELLGAHFVDHWTVSLYAATIGVSRTHLSRLTRAATGESPSRLIDHRLIREARRDLAYTNLPISTIAKSLGFADPAYFSRVFARVATMSPSEFRRNVNPPLSVRG